jgi:hypothetical protein
MSSKGIVSFFVLMLVCDPAASQWLENGTPFPPASREIAARRAVADGFGGILTLAEHSDWAGNGYLVALRIDGYGIRRWGAVVDTLGGAYYPCIAPDGSGGAIIAAVRGGDLYAYRIDAGGSAAWGTNGIFVCGAGDTIASPSLAGDGAGGCFIAWQDMRNDAGDIYAQRLSPSGTPQWAPGGVPVCDTAQAQREPSVALDGAGGIIVAWSDNRDSLQYDVYAARLSAVGVPLWRVDGVPVCAAAGDQSRPIAAPNGSYGGAVVAWIDARSGNDDLYAQRLLDAGAPSWEPDGVAVCPASGAQNGLVMTPSDANGGLLLAWVDRRGGSADIFAQKIVSTGASAWLAGGAPVCTAAGDQINAGIVPDGVGGALVVWRDGRTDPEPDIYIQHLNASGYSAWAVNGVAVCALSGAQTDPAVVPDGAGGAIVSWTSPHPDQPSAFAGCCQRIDRSGYWGYPAPRIAAVRDVPGDEGGFVNLAWDASRLDPWPYQTILNYSVWRAIRHEDAAALLASGARAMENLSSLDPGTDVEQIRVERLGGATYYWKFISYLYAASLPHYAEVVQTVFDSTAVCGEYHYFQVIAHSSVDPKASWISAADSGYSVDNLAPATPCSLAARQTGDDLRISWKANAEPDLSHYAIFRGMTEDFEPLDPICVLTGTSVVDTAWTNGSNDRYYKLVAYDVHGNASPAAVLRPDAVVATLLQFCAARLVDRGVLIEWRLADIDEGARFRVSRLDAPGDEYAAIEDAAVSRDGLSFAFIDESAKPGGEYRYLVEHSSGGEWRALFETEAIVVPVRPLSLFQNHPNPFNPSTSIRFYVPASARVRLEIYDVAGRRIRSLLDERLAEGFHAASWDGADDEGRQASSGVYFYVLRTDKERHAQKMTLIR